MVSVRGADNEESNTIIVATMERNVTGQGSYFRSPFFAVLTLWGLNIVPNIYTM